MSEKFSIGTKNPKQKNTNTMLNDKSFDIKPCETFFLSKWILFNNENFPTIFNTMGTKFYLNG